MKEVSVLIPITNRIVRIAEGDGSNLFPEDEENGFVDYIMIYEYEYKQGDLIEVNGGQMMLYNTFDELFDGKLGKLIKHGCEFIEVNPDGCIILEKVGF